jgi:hypothetical protein
MIIYSYFWSSLFPIMIFMMIMIQIIIYDRFESDENGTIMAG